MGHQAQVLRRQGYELGQGYLYARPLAAEDLAVRLQPAPQPA
ncbi:hypothetical protein [Dactylosporangium sp. NPDC049140]